MTEQDKAPRYELIVIIDARDDEAGKQELARIGETVTANEGDMGEVDPWGRRKLAYEIKDRREGFYASLYFRGNQKTLSELDRALKLNESVLRHLVLRHEGGPRPDPLAAMGAPAAARREAADDDEGADDDDDGF